MRKILVSSVLIIFLVSSCASLKPNPRPWTPEEKGCAVFFVLAHFADGYTTEQHLDTPHPNTYERNPILGKYPSDGKVVFYFSITGISALVLSHWYPELRKPFLLGYGTLNTGLAIHNID